MNDAKKAEDLLRTLRTQLQKLYPTACELEALLRKNQNGPPDGEADGSFTQASWEATTKAVHAVIAARVACTVALGVAAHERVERELREDDDA